MCDVFTFVAKCVLLLFVLGQVTAFGQPPQADPVSAPVTPALASVQIDRAHDQQAYVATGIFHHPAEAKKSYLLKFAEGHVDSVARSLQVPPGTAWKWVKPAQANDPWQLMLDTGGEAGEITYESPIAPYTVEYRGRLLEGAQGAVFSFTKVLVELSNDTANAWSGKTDLVLLDRGHLVGKQSLGMQLEPGALKLIELASAPPSKLKTTIAYSATLPSSSNPVAFSERVLEIEVPPQQALPRGALVFGGESATTIEHVPQSGVVPSLLRRTIGFERRVYVVFRRAIERYNALEFQDDVLRYQYASGLVYLAFNDTSHEIMLRIDASAQGREVSPLTLASGGFERVPLTLGRTNYVDDPANLRPPVLNQKINDVLKKDYAWLVSERETMGRIHKQLQHVNEQIYLLKSRQATYLQRGGSSASRVFDYRQRIARKQDERRKLLDKLLDQQTAVADQMAGLKIIE